MSPSHSMKHVYVAIPIDVMLREQGATTTTTTTGLSSASSTVRSGSADDIILSSVRRHQDPSVDPTPTFTSTTGLSVAYFVAGSLLGVLFSVVGFCVQEAYRFYNIFWYSLAWSCLTSVASYLLFYGWTTGLVCCCRRSGRQNRFSSSSSSSSLFAPRTSVRSEYHFALGVFLGFCLACVVTDVFLQMPLQSILVTVAIAIAWALVMAYCGSLEEEEDETEGDVDDDDVSSVSRPPQALFRDRKGTVLPLVIV